MARTYLSGDNSRGGEVTAANATYAHLHGWDAGVQIDACRTLDDRDEFVVTMTGGSHGGTTVRLGTVTDTPDGPVWTPAQTDPWGRTPREIMEDEQEEGVADHDQEHGAWCRCIPSQCPANTRREELE